MSVICYVCVKTIKQEPGVNYYVICENCAKQAKMEENIITDAIEAMTGKRPNGTPPIKNNSYMAVKTEEVVNEYKETQKDLDKICVKCDIQKNGIANEILCGGCHNLPERKKFLEASTDNDEVMIRGDVEPRKKKGS